jgi:dTMP kinase
MEWCKQPDAKLPAPDMVLWMQLSVETASRRGDFGRERYESVEMQDKVQHVFTQLRDDTWKDVDATDSIGKVHNDMLQLVLPLTTIPLSPLKSLW